jgi:glycosyltransferase involved in cell wall biosynthesis
VPDRPRPPVLRRLFDDGRDNILFVGRISPNKRIDDLIRVFAVYQRFVRPASRLLLAGDYGGHERYYEALLRMTHELRLSEVVFTGHLEDDDLRACYAAASVFLCLSEHEGVGVPLLEAMSFRVPVVAFDAAAVRETLRGAGVLLRDKRPELVAELIDRLIRDAPLRAAVLATQQRVIDELARVDYSRLILERLAPVLEAA